MSQLLFMNTLLPQGSTGFAKHLCFFFALLACTSVACVQPLDSWAAGTAGGEANSGLAAYLMTIEPGASVWERFGHNAIRIVDPLQGTDLIYTWNRPDLRDKEFFPRFLRGRSYFQITEYGFQEAMPFYVTRNRTVRAQALNLTASQTEDLRDFLERHAQPDNRSFPFDLYRDNCSTRARDALDRVLNGQIRKATDAFPDGRTHRSMTRNLTVDDPLLTGVNALLNGRPTDAPLTAWEQAFIPMELHDRILEILVKDESGNEVPLVENEQILYEASGQPLEKKWPLILIDLGIGLFLGSLIVLTGLATARGSRLARFAFSAFGVVWSLVAGLLGVLLAAAWIWTDHWYVSWNESLFQVNPLSLGLIVLLPMFLYRKKGSRTGYRLVMAVAAMAFMGLILRVLPPFGPGNGEIIAIALPLHLAIAASTWRIAHPGTVPEPVTE